MGIFLKCRVNFKKKVKSNLLLAFWLDDLGTDSPDASVVWAFASVVGVEFVLLLILLALKAGVELWASAISWTCSSNFNIELFFS